MVTETINIVAMDWAVWMIFLGCAILGGLASSFVNNNKTALMWGWVDGNRKSGYRMGILADIIVGLAAAIGILWTMTPQTTLQLFGMGAVAGFGGSSVLAALLNRLAAETSEKEKEQVSSKLEKIRKNEKELDRQKAQIELRQLLVREVKPRRR